MDALTIGVQLLAGALIGACIGMTGIGGGVLILPVLTLGFGLPSTVAVGTAHLYSFLCKLPAVFFHFKQGVFPNSARGQILAPPRIFKQGFLNKGFFKQGFFKQGFFS